MAIESSTIEKLQTVFQRVLPLVDDLADALGILLLISLGITIWIFIFVFQLHHFSLGASIGIAALALIPVLILARFWFALENLKDIPTIAEELMDDVTEDVAQSWHAIKSGKKGALNFFGQAKKMFEIRSILNSADDILEQYFSIGPLVNPFYLFFGVLSLFGLLVLFLVGATLVLLSIFS